MKKKIVCICAFISLIICGGCYETEIDYRFTFSGSELVITGLINESVVEVFVQRTHDPMDKETAIEDWSGQIFLQSDDQQRIMLIQKSPGYFLSPEEFSPSDETVYELLLVSEDGLEIKSNKQGLIKSTPIDTVYSYASDDSAYDVNAFACFHDPGESKNFYAFSYDKYVEGQVFSDDPYVELFSIILDDEIFNGDQFCMSRSIQRSVSQYGVRVPVDSVRVSLFSLSEELYDYLMSIKDYKGTYGDALYEQPLFVKNYFTNAYGVFGSYATDRFVLRLN